GTSIVSIGFLRSAQKRGRFLLWKRPCVMQLGFDANCVASAQNLLPYYDLVRRPADSVDKCHGVYMNTVIGRSDSGLACSAVRNPTCGLFVEFRRGLFQLGLRERTFLHEYRPPCVCCQCHISTMPTRCQ